MKLTARALTKFKPDISGIQAEHITRIIDEMVYPFRYLNYSGDWEFHPTKTFQAEKRHYDVRWTNPKRTGLTVTIPIKYRVVNPEGGYTNQIIYAETILSSGRATLNDSDKRFVTELVKAGNSILTIISRNSDPQGTLHIAAIEEMASLGVSAYLKKLAGLDCDLYPIIRHLVRLSAFTYENQRVAFGILFDRVNEGRISFPNGVRGNKRFLRLTDGINTALVLDSEGCIIGLEPLVHPIDYEEDLLDLPRWLAPLAQASSGKRSLALALTRNGEIHVLYNGEYVASRRAGRWSAWNHDQNLARLKALTGIAGEEYALVRTMYRVALDLSTKRSGGLLVWLQDEKGAQENQLIPETDLIGSDEKEPGDRALDDFFQDSALMPHRERSILVDIAALDGAVVFSRSGQLLAYGSVLKNTLASGEHSDPGSRTKAAYSASMYGLAIKVSSDGDITVFYSGQKQFSI